jgi:hypothetical protein
MKKVVKKMYEIRARYAEVGERVYNFLEDAHYVTSSEKCIVLTGTAGEQWVITAEKLQKTYMLNGEPIVGNVAEIFATEQVVETKAGAEVYFAEFLPVEQKMSVKTSWGEVLQANRDGVPHGDGDYIVCSSKEDGAPNHDDRWVVNGLVFANTYEFC